MDTRVRSSLGRNRILFPPYNADELARILTERAREGIMEGALDEEVIPYCSALAAQRDGDARLAIDLLREACKKYTFLPLAASGSLSSYRIHSLIFSNLSEIEYPTINSNK